MIPSGAGRLFGFIASGATIGGLIGPLFPALLAETLGATNLLLITAALLGVAIYCIQQLGDWQDEHPAPGRIPGGQDEAMGGGILAAIRLVFSSPYLIGVCFLVFFYTVLGTFVYFQKAYIIEESFTDSNTRTAVFAWMDFATNFLTLLFEWFLTGRIVKRFGLSTTLMILPVIFGLGFLMLGVSPVLSVIVVFEVLRRSMNYSINRPSPRDAVHCHHEGRTLQG